MVNSVFVNIHVSSSKPQQNTFKNNAITTGASLAACLPRRAVPNRGLITGVHSKRI